MAGADRYNRRPAAIDGTTRPHATPSVTDRIVLRMARAQQHGPVFQATLQIGHAVGRRYVSDIKQATDLTNGIRGYCLSIIDLALKLIPLIMASVTGASRGDRGPRSRTITITVSTGKGPSTHREKSSQSFVHVFDQRAPVLHSVEVINHAMCPGHHTSDRSLSRLP